MAAPNGHKDQPAKGWQELQTIIHQANQGDRSALERLRQFLDENPHVWAQLGDLARVAEQAWLTLISDGNSLTAEALKRQLTQLKQELLDGGSTVIERMLADTVIATWLELHYLRTVDADSRQRSANQASVLIKRLESAQRRHHNALKQLTQLRKLLPNRTALPPLQVYRYEEQVS